MSEQVQVILLWSIPLAVLQSANVLLRNYINAQGIETVYGYFTVFNLLLTSLMSFTVLQQMKLGVAGWVLFRVFFELMNLGFSMYLYLTRLDFNTVGTIDFNLFKQTYRTFALDTTIFSLTFYFEFLGIETSIFFVGRSKNYLQIAAYISFMNFIRVILSIGKGFSIILRTRINLLIGKRSQTTAENFFWYFYSSIVVTGCLLGVITCIGSRRIASIYSVN